MCIMNLSWRNISFSRPGIPFRSHGTKSDEHEKHTPHPLLSSRPTNTRLNGLSLADDERKTEIEQNSHSHRLPALSEAGGFRSSKTPHRISSPPPALLLRVFSCSIPSSIFIHPLGNFSGSKKVKSAEGRHE